MQYVCQLCGGIVAEQIVASCGCLETEATWKEFERGGGVVVAQLADRSLLTPEVRGSNPVIGKILYKTRICCSLLTIRR